MTVWTVATIALLPPEAIRASETLQLIEGDILTSAEPLSRRGVMFARHTLWADGVMPVWIDPAIADASRTEVRAAMAIWNRVAGVRLDELSAPLPDGQDYVHIELGEGCASWVGRRGGAQSLWVAPACSRGAVLHELGHALGLEHEHTRPDRDAWIRIHWDNIEPERRHNFNVAPAGTRLLGDYDYASLMHYGADFFGIASRTTIEPLDPRARIGQRRSPSAGDIAAIAELYGTDLALSADVFDGSVANTLSLQAYVTNQGGTGAHAVHVETRLPPGWQLISSQSKKALPAPDAWHCEGEPMLTCTLSRLAPGALAVLSLELSASTAVSLATEPLELRVDAGNHDARPDNDTASLRRVEPSDGSGDVVDDALLPDDAWLVTEFPDEPKRTGDEAVDGSVGARLGQGVDPDADSGAGAEDPAASSPHGGSGPIGIAGWLLVLPSLYARRRGRWPRPESAPNRR